MLNVLLGRNKKEEDPAVFTKAATKLEAGACRLQLPEVRHTLHITVVLDAIISTRCISVVLMLNCTS